MKPLQFTTLGLAMLLVAACSITPAVRQEVTEVIQFKKDNHLTCDPATPNRCAIETPFATAYTQALNQQRDRMLILDKGDESLLARIHLIRSAQESIHIQTFIWVNDEAGQLMVSELLAAAKRGVKVKVIIDQLFSMGNSWLVSNLATLHQNIEFRLYNPVFQDAHTSPFEFFSALACCMARLNKRMHNKAFVVDNKYGIVGGRNYQSRYYDWDESFNYKDRDVLAIGAVVNDINVSFDQFWHSPYVVAAEHLRDVSMRILRNQAPDIDWAENLTEKSAKLITQSEDLALIQNTFGSDIVAVDAVEYFSDTHDKPFNRKARKANEQLTQRIHQYFRDAKQEILIQTPYLIFSRTARKTLKKLRKANPDLSIRVSTNSLASTDAYYVYAISYKYKRFYLKKLKMQIYEYKDRPGMAEQHFNPKHFNERTRFGMHSKSFVIDDYLSMIGSHNFDPRSDVLNTESGFVIHSKEFAQKLSQSIEIDMLDTNSWVVAAKEQIPFFSHLSGFFATISRKLPIFDIWPFRYSTSYRLRPNHEPVPANHPDFHKNYEPIGNFPNVNLSSKQIQTIIISAFAGFAEPVM